MASKDPVRIREKANANGVKSLYLDIYVNGKRTYKYLRLYLYPEIDAGTKKANRETRRLAESVRAKYLIEVQNGRFGFDTQVLTKAHLRKFLEEAKETQRSKMFTSAMNFAARYFAKDVLIGNLTREDVVKYKTHIERSYLKHGTQLMYFAYFKKALKMAEEAGIIAHSPAANVAGFAQMDVERNYLTFEEIQILARTECKYSVVKRAFMFSCLTGLRYSDVSQLQWANVKREQEFTRLTFRQEKTEKIEYYDISPEADIWLGERGEDDSLVFANLPSNATMRKHLGEWVKNTGISKHITFHCARHSFATLMISLGVDLYVVSRLLGHRNISTTQIYAKMRDKVKQDAVLKIPKL